MTRRQRALRSRPRDAAVMPLPRLETTPPVTKTCLVTLPPVSTRVPMRPNAWRLPIQAPGKAVDRFQPSRPLDDGGEGPSLRSQIQGHEQYDGDDPLCRPQGESQSEPEDGAERVRPSVAEHRPLLEIGGKAYRE